MAQREQHGNKEKKKPKANKADKSKPAQPSYVEPALVRKPHKAKPAG